MKRTIVVACVFLLWATAAWAQPKTAEDWFKEGSTQYNLGEFEKAAEAFKQAFTLETNDAKKPAYLYNVAQAYRQAQKCKDAVFFYKRFISLKDGGMGKPLSTETRQKTEELITEAEQCAKQAEAVAQKQPDSTMPPEGTGNEHTTTTTTAGAGSGSGSAAVTTTATGSGSASTTKVATRDNGNEGNEGNGNEEDNGIHKTGNRRMPQFVSARVLAGPGKIETGGLDIPFETTITAIAGYPLHLSPELTLELGAAFTVTPVPFQDGANGMKETASMTELLANAGVTYAVTPKIGARGDVGVGVLWFNGISDYGNPFTENGSSTSGSLGMFAVRVSASVDYLITPNVVVTLAPLTFSYSPAASGLASNISSFARVDILAGLGVRI